jgi:hypothetical protein
MFFAKSKSDSVRTPDYILEWVTNTFGEWFDPTPFQLHFDPEKHQDGLVIPWKTTNYCNPPFSIAYKFLRKCYKEYKVGNITVFLCKTDLLGRKCFRGMCDIVFFHNKVRFPGYGDKPPRFSCCMLVFHAGADNKFLFFEELGGDEFVPATLKNVRTI